MGANWNKEELSLLRISGEEGALIDITEEVALVSVLPCEAIRISSGEGKLVVLVEDIISVHIHLEFAFHFFVSR